MDLRPIGVFDSGLGGLTAVRELRRLLPAEDILYFGDTGRVPYGGRGPDTIRRYAGECMRFLERRGVKMIIVACGTVSSVLGQTMGEGFSVPCLGVLAPTAAAAARASQNGRIGVIATTATIASGSYGRAIGAVRPDAVVFPMACPLFVPLVENGYTQRDNRVTGLVAREYFAGFDGAGIDTLILGCTHYPLIAPLIDDVTGNRLNLIDAGRETAAAARELMEQRELLSYARKIGSLECFVTDEVRGFAEIGERFLGERLSEVSRVELEEL